MVVIYILTARADSRFWEAQLWGAKEFFLLLFVFEIRISFKGDLRVSRETIMRNPVLA